jgi:hypothetical protein
MLIAIFNRFEDVLPEIEPCVHYQPIAAHTKSNSASTALN